jgi:protein gp37
VGKTAISWTQSDDGTPGKTWNCIKGCSRVSEGCRHCYAEVIAGRFSGPGQAYEGLATRKLKTVSDGNPGRKSFKQATEGRWTGEVRFVPERLADPLRWKRPRRIFVNSMSDLFHEKLEDAQIAAVFGVMAAAPRHTFQVLTKRARRMCEWFEWIAGGADTPANICAQHADLELTGVGHQIWGRARGAVMRGERPWPLPNVWIGVSVENQDAADERIPEILETPAAVRFISAEPLLGPLDIATYLDPAGAPCGETNAILDWVIVGAESGHGARPCDVRWIRAIRDQCEAAGVPLWLKQANELRSQDAGELKVGDAHPIAVGKGSKRKGKTLIELPYLDGEQHAEFPR